MSQFEYMATYISIGMNARTLGTQTNEYDSDIRSLTEPNYILKSYQKTIMFHACYLKSIKFSDTFTE